VKVLFYLWLFSLLNAQSFLIEVQLNPQDLIRYKEKGIDFILDFDDLVLVKGNKATISLIESEKISYKILDTITEGDNYYLFWKPNTVNWGKIITEREGYFVVKAKEQDFSSLLIKGQRPPEGVYKIPLTPISLNFPTKSFIPKYDSLIQEMVNKVSSETIIGFVRRLQAFRTRYSTTDSARACANFIKDKFLSYGLDSVYFHTHRANYAPNVIGIKRGILPDSIYVVICGHFDCTSESPATYAPGADDNGSGTAALLEAARILKDYNFDHSLRFIAFSGEEQGLLGSYSYCSLARYVNQDSIIGAINVDMIAYTLTNRDSSSIIGKPSNPNCAPLVDYFITCANTYTELKCQRQVINRPRSDHASFNQFGYLAIHIRENLNLNNPYYHTTGDTIGGGFNDLDFVTKVIKACVATLASLAKPLPVSVPEAKKKFYLAKDEKDWLVYNIFGQLISEGTSNRLNRKGKISSGIYFLISRDKRERKKIVAIR